MPRAGQYSASTLSKTFLLMVACWSLPTPTESAGLRAQRLQVPLHTGASEKETRLSIYCFAWTPLHRGDSPLLPLAIKEFEACDGHAIFTDKEAPMTLSARTGSTGNSSANSADSKLVASLLRVQVPTQEQPRDNDKWLYHKNMAGLLPALSFLLKDKTIEKYDWIVNSELDHYLRPTKVRAAVAQYLEILRVNGTAAEKQAADSGPMMLNFGNAFLFNRRLVQELARQWDTFGKQFTQAGAPGVGCPDWMQGRAFWPQACAQDIVFPIMVRIMDPPVMQFGASGCGQTRKTANGHELPMACWDMTKAGPRKGKSIEEAQAEAIRSIARIPGVAMLEAAYPTEAIEDDRATVGSSRTAQDAYAVRLQSTLRAAQEALADIEVSSGAGARRATPVLAALGQTATRTRSRAHRVVDALVEMQREQSQESSGKVAVIDALPDISIPLIHHVQYASGHALAQKLLPL